MLSSFRVLREFLLLSARSKDSMSALVNLLTASFLLSKSDALKKPAEQTSIEQANDAPGVNKTLDVQKPLDVRFIDLFLDDEPVDSITTDYLEVGIDARKDAPLSPFELFRFLEEGETDAAVAGIARLASVTVLLNAVYIARTAQAHLPPGYPAMLMAAMVLEGKTAKESFEKLAKEKWHTGRFISFGNEVEKVLDAEQVLSFRHPGIVPYITLTQGDLGKKASMEEELTSWRDHFNKVHEEVLSQFDGKTNKVSVIEIINRFPIQLTRFGMRVGEKFYQEGAITRRKRHESAYPRKTIERFLEVPRTKRDLEKASLVAYALLHVPAINPRVNGNTAEDVVYHHMTDYELNLKKAMELANDVLTGKISLAKVGGRRAPVTNDLEKTYTMRPLFELDPTERIALQL